MFNEDVEALRWEPVKSLHVNSYHKCQRRGRSYFHKQTSHRLEWNVIWILYSRCEIVAVPQCGPCGIPVIWNQTKSFWTSYVSRFPSFTAIVSSVITALVMCVYVCLLCRKTRLTARPVPRMNSWRLTRAVEWDGGLRPGMMVGRGGRLVGA